MARLETIGYELGTIDEDGGLSATNYGTIGVVTSSPAPRSGSYCAKGITTNSGSSYYAYRIIRLSANQTQIGQRIAYYIGPASGETVITIWRDRDSADGTQMELRWDPADSLLKAYRGTTLVASASTTMIPNAWHVLRINHLVNTTTGVFQVHLDTVASPVIDFSGNTCATANANIRSYGVGFIARSASSGGNSFVAWDDIATNDTSGSYETSVPSDGAVLLLVPNGAGATTQWAPSTGSNYTCVDEVPASSTDYVSTSSADQIDTYALANVPAQYNAVKLVQPVANAALAVAGTGTLRCVLRSGGTDYPDSADKSLSTSYAIIKGDVRYVDPADSAAWTITKANNLEAGVKSV
jgi:hypothetical protein